MNKWAKEGRKESHTSDRGNHCWHFSPHLCWRHFNVCADVNLCANMYMHLRIHPNFYRNEIKDTYYSTMSNNWTCHKHIPGWAHRSYSTPYNGYIRFHSEKAMAPHSSTLAWKIPWTEEPGRLQSMGLLRAGHDFFTFMHWRRKWQPTPVFLPGESQGRRGLMGCRLWGRTESDTTEAT